MKNLKYTFAFLILLISGYGYAQEGEKTKPLFSSEEVLEIVIAMDVRTVINNRKVEDRVDHKAKLSYLTSEGDSVSYKIKVRVRGNNRANPQVCSFPPLKLDFKKKKVDSTLFEGQNKLKLVTHCKPGASGEEFILREYYTYKLYEMISPYSFKVRLCRIKYVDTEGKFKDDSHYGFLIEDIDDVAARNGMVEYKEKVLNQEVCERKELDRLMFFQYLIGNLDWSVPYMHNFKLVANKERPRPVAIPYDFDYAGIINKPDATPPVNFEIASVRERVFRGLCRAEGGYDDALNYFQEKKSDIYSLYESSPYLSDKSKKYTVNYLNSFYKILDDPKKVRQNIVTACWANHKHLYQY